MCGGQRREEILGSFIPSLQIETQKRGQLILDIPTVDTLKKVKVKTTARRVVVVVITSGYQVGRISEIWVRVDIYFEDIY